MCAERATSDPAWTQRRCPKSATLASTDAFRSSSSSDVFAFCACTAYNNCMQYTIRKVSNTLDTVLRRWAREQGKSLNEVAIEAMAHGAGLTGRTVRQRDLHDIAGTWREDRAFDR